jgi:hypothetical protein
VAATGSVNKTNEAVQREVDQSLSAPSEILTTPEPVDLRAEELASRRRAGESAARTGSSKRKASQSLTYLGA